MWCTDLQSCLFNHLLWLLHGLLSNDQPSWMKSQNSSKSVFKLDRDTLEKLQSELDHMQLPSSIRRHIQTAMPILPKRSHSISCKPSSISDLFDSPIPMHQSFLKIYTKNNQHKNPSHNIVYWEHTTLRHISLLWNWLDKGYHMEITFTWIMLAICKVTP